MVDSGKKKWLIDNDNQDNGISRLIINGLDRCKENYAADQDNDGLVN